jgi:RNA polymerase sigma factor (sigma-70 family)
MLAQMVKPLDQMYEAHHGMVFRTAYRITGNAADAEDVLQTVFLRMVRGNPAVENPESYLRRSAVNAALDVVRARHDNDTLEPERMAASGSCTRLAAPGTFEIAAEKCGDVRDAVFRRLYKSGDRETDGDFAGSGGGDAASNAAEA